MKEMTFKVASSSKVLQCLFFKIALHLDMPENQKFMDEQKLTFRKSFMNWRILQHSFSYIYFFSKWKCIGFLSFYAKSL